MIKVGLGPQQPTQADTKRVWEPLSKMACDQIGADLDLTVANDWAGISVALASQQLDVGSTSGWLVPTHFMRGRGIDPKTCFGKYAEGASAAAAQMATAGGQVDLATGWDTHRNTMLRNGQIKPESNRVVWESDRLPNEPVVVRRGFDPALASRLQATLANTPQDQARALMPWPYSGFVAATGAVVLEAAPQGLTAAHESALYAGAASTDERLRTEARHAGAAEPAR